MLPVRRPRVRGGSGAWGRLTRRRVERASSVHLPGSPVTPLVDEKSIIHAAPMEAPCPPRCEGVAGPDLRAGQALPAIERKPAIGHYPAMPETRLLCRVARRLR
ncbi:hypothetical protein PSm6_49780 [Pseudomonas solani]|uniref:Uncharacterized protein n=1 Tax=Pseudomonas solani TaxID=2731552 RepID=A0ABM7LG50_9PSED|nr:hypothetical protein PSm6_49780 [Pseudomonas solani]